MKNKQIPLLGYYKKKTKPETINTDKYTKSENETFVTYSKKW